MARRRTTKIDPQENELESGAFLDEDERFQTDAEWHADILEEIETHQSQTNDWLNNIFDENREASELLQMQNDKLDRLCNLLDERLKNFGTPQPMKTWRFIVIIITIILLAAAFTQ